MKRIIGKTSLFFHLSSCIFLLNSCQEGSSEKPIGEFITRKEGENLFSVSHPILQQLPKYPWDKKEFHRNLKLTKNHFRCKGKGIEREWIKEDGSYYLEDCDGDHSLPLRNGKEFIYPILIDLLNFLQQVIKKEVVITTGHSCPVHNRFLDPGIKNAYSKHQIGGEVSFYIKGMEYEPETIILLIKAYYKKEKDDSLRRFERYDKQTNVSTRPWFNKEIFIKLFKATEGRDIDNTHPYPYINLQVRFDRDKKERVIFKDELALISH